MYGVVAFVISGALNHPTLSPLSQNLSNRADTGVCPYAYQGVFSEAQVHLFCQESFGRCLEAKLKLPVIGTQARGKRAIMTIL